MFGFFKRKKLSREEEAINALIKWAEKIKKINWNKKDIACHLELQNAVGSITIAWKQAVPEIPVEPESLFVSIINGYPGSEGYSDEDRAYLFDQLRTTHGDPENTAIVMLYMIAPKYTSQTFGLPQAPTAQ